MNLIFKWETVFYERAPALNELNKMFFRTREYKIHFLKPPREILF